MPVTRASRCSFQLASNVRPTPPYVHHHIGRGSSCVISPLFGSPDVPLPFSHMDIRRFRPSKFDIRDGLQAIRLRVHGEEMGYTGKRWYDKERQRNREERKTKRFTGSSPTPDTSKKQEKSKRRNRHNSDKAFSPRNPAAPPALRLLCVKI